MRKGRGRWYWLGVGISEPKGLGRVMSHSLYDKEEESERDCRR